MTWALAARAALAVAGRWGRAVLRRLPQLLIAAGAVVLLLAAGEWWAGVRAAPLRVEIARLQAAVGRHEDAIGLAAETAALAVQASQDRADAKHREDTHEINRLLEREAGLLAAGADDRSDLARRLREQWAAGRAAGRRDRDGVPQAGGDRHPPPAAATAPGMVPVPGRDPDPDRFDLAAELALTGEQMAAVCRVLYDAALAGRHIKLTRTTP